MPLSKEANPNETKPKPPKWTLITEYFLISHLKHARTVEYLDCISGER